MKDRLRIPNSMTMGSTMLGSTVVVIPSDPSINTRNYEFNCVFFSWVCMFVIIMAACLVGGVHEGTSRCENEGCWMGVILVSLFIGSLLNLLIFAFFINKDLLGQLFALNAIDDVCKNGLECIRCVADSCNR